MKCWHFSELSWDKKNLKWIFISYGIYETSCVFYIPEPLYIYISNSKTMPLWQYGHLILQIDHCSQIRQFCCQSTKAVWGQINIAKIFFSNRYNGLLNHYNELLNHYNELLNHYNELLNRYNGLLNHYNELLNRYNGLLNHYNELLNRYNGLLNHYNELLNRYNGLLNRYNGLRKRDLQEDTRAVRVFFGYIVTGQMASFQI